VDFWDIHNGKLSPHNVVRSYRVWIPLNGMGVGSFVSAMQAAHPESVSIISEHVHKRPRVAPTPVVPTNKIHTTDDLTRALRLYFEGRESIAALRYDTDDTSNIGVPLLEVLSARKYFAQDTTIDKHSKQRLAISQSTLDAYLQTSETGEARFYPAHTVSELLPPMDVCVLVSRGICVCVCQVREGELCRLITTGPTGFLKHARDILRYLLPQYTPPKSLVYNKIRQVMDACGSTLEIYNITDLKIEDLIHMEEDRQQGELLYDPINYSPLQSTADKVLGDEAGVYEGALERQLCEIYPVSARLKATYTLRIDGAILLGGNEVELVLRNMNNDIATLLSTSVEGIPTVYHELYHESQRTLESMADPACQPVTNIMKKMLYKQRPEHSCYTSFGFRMNTLVAGCRSCLLLTEKQTALFLILYARHFAVTANRTGVSGFFIVAGPPDTGKSYACQTWLGCIAKSLQLQSDGGSAKSYTADDKSRDLRCAYEDEFKDLTDGTDGGSDANSKAKQSLYSNGILRYERLIPDSDSSNEYHLQIVLKAERKMVSTCTNVLKNVSPAMQSRASIIPLTGKSTAAVHAHTQHTSGNLVAIRDNKTVGLLGQAFMMQLQCMSSLQGRFWQLEAFGAIGTIDTTCFTVFQLLLEKHHGSSVLKTRRMLDIKHTSEALMVHDLTRMWYTGIGAPHGMDTTLEAMFYRSRAVVRMEHVCAAFCVISQSTSFDVHVKEIHLLLKSMLRVDDGGRNYLRSSCGEYFVMRTKNKRSLHYDVNQQMSHLGVGITSQILEIIERGCTHGNPNLKYSSENNADVVYMNCSFAASVYNATEHAILEVLTRIKENSSTVCDSYDELHYVFRASVRESICYSAYSSDTHPELQHYESSALQLAVSVLEHGRTKTGMRVWTTPQEHTVCQEVEETVPIAEPYVSDPTRFKVREDVCMIVCVCVCV
jgi:hypothetical protein